VKKTLNEEKQRILEIIYHIDESFKKLTPVNLNESDDDYDYEIEYAQDERENELKSGLFNDFLYHNTLDFTKHVPWTVIPFPRLKKIWNDYMTYGSIRDTRGLEMIEDIMIDNTTKVSIFTNLAGHTQWGDEEAFRDNIGYWVNEQVNCLLPQKKEDRTQLEIPFNNPQKGYQEKEQAPEIEPCDVTIHPFAQNVFDENYDEEMSREQFHELLYEKMKDRFFDYYQNDPKEKLGGFISDYGLEPLMKLLSELLRSTTPEEKLLIIDRILNVVHQRSDIAEWFVEGGSKALSQLSGSPSEAINENSCIFISKSHTMKKTLQEETNRILEISRKVNEQIDSEDGNELDSMKRSILNYWKDNPVSNSHEQRSTNDTPSDYPEFREKDNETGDNSKSQITNDKNPIWVDIDEFIKGCKKEGMDNDSIKSEIMKYVDTLLPDDEDEGPDANDIDSDGREYGEQYNKNMTQGFSSINEGNAFVGAAKKANEEGKDSFVLDGKTYKVTVSKSKK